MAWSIPGVACFLCLLLAVVRTEISSECEDSDCTCSFGRIPSLSYPSPPANCTHPLNGTGPAISGCFCPSGLLLFNDELCVQPENCSTLTEPGDDILAVDKCSPYQTCDLCISSDPDCQWCPYLLSDVLVKGSRCRDRNVNPLCPVELNDPVPSVEATEDIDFGDSVQVRPQRMKLRLRTGKAEEFSLNFRLAENYPLDVYFLLDVSGSFASDFRRTVKGLTTQIVDELKTNISSDFTVGFGIFSDKRALPFSLTLDSGGERAYIDVNDFTGVEECISGLDLADCNPTISFRHISNMSQRTSDELQEILANITIHPNIDAFEGGLDGVMQILACEDIIGWRENSLKMLLYMTNAGFHSAGDGRLGAAFRPHPGTCLLQETEDDGRTFFEYNEDAFYDYPSVYQIRQHLIRSQTNIIFAINSQNLESPIYESLQRELGVLAQVTELLSDASNLVSVIRTSFERISQVVRLFPAQDYPNLSFSFSPGNNCTPTESGEGCTNVSLGDIVSLNVKVTMTSCLDSEMTAILQSPAFGTVQLDIEPLCECPCTSQPSYEDEECSGSGTLLCGQCLCPNTTAGDQCQCSAEIDFTETCGSDIELEQCAGPERGVCNCTECICYIQEELLEKKNVIKRYFGEFCQCDDLNSCKGLASNGKLCSDRGRCDCPTDMCICEERGEISDRLYFGDQCECNPDLCYNAQYPDRKCVYTGDLAGQADAKCTCGGCNCTMNADAIGGLCIPICETREPCARCVKDLHPPGTDCTKCNASLYTPPSPPVTHPIVCRFQVDDDCYNRFYLSTVLTTILVAEDLDCTDAGGSTGDIGQLAWIIPVAVIGGLLVLGGIILLIVVLLVWIFDRLEYQKFKKDLEQANWDQQENPMYVSPQQQYTNVAYKKRKKSSKKMKSEEFQREE